MESALRQFQQNIQSVKNLDSIYVAFENQVTPVVDLTEILRAEIIQIVSALDCFIHDLVRIKMLKIFKNNLLCSNAFNNFSITIECLKNIENSSNINDKLFFLDQEIRKINGFKSFQDPDKISSALSIIGIKKLWEKIGEKFCDTPTNLRNRLTVIVERRNQIAHESDIDPTLGIGLKFPINHELVIETSEFIEKLVYHIYKLVEES
jgi:hypothetical protein